MMEARRNLLSAVVSRAIFSSGLVTLMVPCMAAAANFNTSMMAGDSAQAGWNNADQTIAPGIYDLDVYINGDWRGNLPVKVVDERTFYLNDSSISILSIKMDKLPQGDRQGDWTPVSQIIHGGQANLNAGQLRLNLTIPQAYIYNKDRSWIAPELWNAGINGAFTNYNLSYYNSHRQDGYGDANNVFLSLNSGINLAGWQFIDNSNFLKNRATDGQWVNNSRYVERALPALRSVVRVGDSYTSSPWFDSLRFRGVTLKQDQRMYPDSYRTYMPVIRGVATSNAVVKIYQNDAIVYQLNVPPGPFEIDDMMPTGSRNDLTVEVVNGGGSTERFTVPYSTVSDMLREGTSEWLLTAGKVQMQGIDEHPAFVQGDISHGMNNYLTLYSGTTLSPDYYSALVGSAISIPGLGSFSGNVDIASARQQNGKTFQGQRWKLSFSRYFATKTNLTLATFYYDTSGYLSFYDAVQMNDIARKQESAQIYKRSKQSFNINLDQTLPEGWGRIALDGYWQQYWNSQQSSRQYSLTYSNNFHRATWSLSVRRNHYEYDSNNSSNEYDEQNYGNRKSYDENRIELMLTLPFTLLGNNANMTVRSALRDGKYGGSEVGANGSTGLLDYSLNYSHDYDGNDSVFGGYGAWRTPWARFTGNYSQSSEYRQLGGSVSGSAVLWRGGVLASGNAGNTFVILDAPGIAGATVNGNREMRTNASGVVLVPSVTPYRMNNYRLENNQNSASSGELKGNIGHIAPWAGSISYIRYQTDTRKVFTLSAHQVNGQPLPFGADVKDRSGNDMGYVSQGSQLYVKADQLPEWLEVQLAEGEACRIHSPKTDGDNLCLMQKSQH